MGRRITETAQVRPAAIPAWERLQAALMSTDPACAGDARYITDAADLEPEDRGDMQLVCASCPLLNYCTDYAAADRPRGGWWPGHNLNTRKDTA